MSSSNPSESSKERVKRHREKLRAQGLRPLQIWVPDVHSPEFARQAHLEALAIANSPFEKEDQAFVDSISVFWDEDFDEAW